MRFARIGAIAAGISMRSMRRAHSWRRSSCRAPRARAKFGAGKDDDPPCASGAGAGYSVRAARGLTQWALTQLLAALPGLTEAERHKLKRTSPHAFRHTVATQMIASGGGAANARARVARNDVDLYFAGAGPLAARSGEVSRATEAGRGVNDGRHISLVDFLLHLEKLIGDQHGGRNSAVCKSTGY